MLMNTCVYTSSRIFQTRNNITTRRSTTLTLSMKLYHGDDFSMYYVNFQIILNRNKGCSKVVMQVILIVHCPCQIQAKKNLWLTYSRKLFVTNSSEWNVTDRCSSTNFLTQRYFFFFTLHLHRSEGKNSLLSFS